MYYLYVKGRTIGPMDAAQVVSYDIDENTLVSKNGGEWLPLYTYPELMEMYANSAGKLIRDSEVTNKRIICGVCAILLGSFGVQYFVVNKILGGFLTILLTLVTCGLWSCLCLAQGIYMLCIDDKTFKSKYIDSTSVLPLF